MDIFRFDKQVGKQGEDISRDEMVLKSALS